MPDHFPTFRKLFGIDPVDWSWSAAALWPRWTTAAQRRAVLRLIAVATEERVPVAPLLGAWANSECGVQASRLRKAVRLLNAGTPLAEVVERVRGLVSDDEALAVRFGAQTGTLAETLRTQLVAGEVASSEIIHRWRHGLWYFVLLAVVTLVTISFYTIKIVPEFEKIFQEFSLDVSPWFKVALQVTQVLGSLLVWVVPLLILLGLWSYFSRTPGRVLRNSLLTPLFKPLQAARKSQLFSLLGVAVGAGRPTPGAIAALARHHYDPHTRRQLLEARNDMELGAPGWSSLADAEVISPAEATLLATGDELGNQPWLLTKLAEVSRTRAADGAERWARFVFPAVVFVMGAFVLLQAVAVFEMLYSQLVGGLA